jgi:hypothetical protein
MQALPFELQDYAAKDALFLEKFYNAAGFHVGPKLPESPEMSTKRGFGLRWPGTGCDPVPRLNLETRSDQDELGFAALKIIF